MALRIFKYVGLVMVLLNLAVAAHAFFWRASPSLNSLAIAFVVLSFVVWGIAIVVSVLPKRRSVFDPAGPMFATVQHALKATSRYVKAGLLVVVAVGVGVAVLATTSSFNAVVERTSQGYFKMGDGVEYPISREQYLRYTAGGTLFATGAALVVNAGAIFVGFGYTEKDQKRQRKEPLS